MNTKTKRARQRCHKTSWNKYSIKERYYRSSKCVVIDFSKPLKKPNRKFMRMFLMEAKKQLELEIQYVCKQKLFKETIK